MYNVNEWPLERIYQRPPQRWQNKGLLSPHCARIKISTKSSFWYYFQESFKWCWNHQAIKSVIRCQTLQCIFTYTMVGISPLNTTSQTIMSQYLCKKYEIDLIYFLTRFRCIRRKSPYCKLHCAYIHYTKVKNVLYVNDCQDKERIITVTLFFTMLFNACFTYQKSNASNMQMHWTHSTWILHYMMTHSWTLTVSTFLHIFFSILEYFASYILLTTYLSNLLQRWVVFLCIQHWMCYCNINCKKYLFRVPIEVRA